MADHGYPQDVKVNITEDDDNSAPPPFTENELAQPLLAAEKGQAPTDQAPAEPRSRCPFRDRFRRSGCNSEKRKNKSRKFFRRLFAAIALFWVYTTFFSDDYNEDGWTVVPYESNDVPKDFTPTWRNPVSPIYQSLDVLSLKDMSSDKCTDDLVPWEGASLIETDLQTIRIGFDKGNIVSNVTVRSGNVVIPTILIRANVTKVDYEGGDDDDDNDDDDDDNDDNDDDDGEQTHKKGLHLKIRESDDALNVKFWADRYVRTGEDSPPEEPQPPHRKHPHHHRHHGKHHRHHHKNHKKHRKHHDRDGDDEEEMTLMKRRDLGFLEPGRDRRYKRFCAAIEVELVLPEGDDNLYSIIIGGVVVSTKVEDVENIGFKELIIGAVAGEIKIDSIYADSLAAEVVAGKVTVESVQVATEGLPLRVKTKATVGEVNLNAKTAPIRVANDDDEDEDEGDNDNDDNEEEENKCADGDEEEDGDHGKKKKRLSHHLVIAGATAGTVNADITEAFWDDDIARSLGETIPGLLVARIGTSTGRSTSSIDLVEGRRLNFKTGATSGTVIAKVSDLYQGKLAVGAFLGKADVIEAEDSESVIVYEKNTSRSKIGRKFIDDEGDEVSGGRNEIVVNTGFGDSTLEFF
ncbi:hypothetical protein BGX26_001694 [Mortierella sp. AD094]|nr:hypothetical protein BGX26_001694 [Mortierella sp. AD094]